MIVLLNFKEKKFLLRLHSLGFGPFQCFHLVHRSMWLPNHCPSDISAGNFTFKVEMSKSILKSDVDLEVLGKGLESIFAGGNLGCVDRDGEISGKS